MPRASARSIGGTREPPSPSLGVNHTVHNTSSDTIGQSGAESAPVCYLLQQGKLPFRKVACSWQLLKKSVISLFCSACTVCCELYGRFVNTTFLFQLGLGPKDSTVPGRTILPAYQVPRWKKSSQCIADTCIENLRPEVF